MKKKLFALILTAGIIAGAVCAEAGEPDIYVDGAKLSLDTAPIHKNDRILVPFRAIAESLGANVEWDGSLKSVTCTKDGTVLVLTVNSDIMLKNSNAVRLDTTPVISDGRVMIPVRAVSEGFGAKVSWYAKEGIINIRTDLSPDADVLSEQDAVTVEIHRERKDFKDSRGSVVFTYDSAIPLVTSSGDISDKINANISSNLSHYLDTEAERMRQDALLASDIAYAGRTSLIPRSLTAESEVTYQNDDFLSIVITCTAEGCSLEDGSLRKVLPLVYNIKTGEYAELYDVVSEKAATKAKGAITAQIKKDEHGFYDNYAELIQSRDPKFFISDKGITFLYDGGFLNKDSLTDVRYTMPFEEAKK